MKVFAIGDHVKVLAGAYAGECCYCHLNVLVGFYPIEWHYCMWRLS